jgi:hypothetical protein
MASIPLIPWEPSVFPQVYQDELNRRKKNRGLNFISTAQDDEWEQYRGPTTPWVRLCSNGAGRLDPYDDVPSYTKQGFVLYGGKDFYSSYGFLSPDGIVGNIHNESIIGYMPNGQPHVIQNDILTSHYPIHVPPPEIEKISLNIQKELYRRATVEWVCFSTAQLEYMTPYFLVMGISCTLEWGWNNFNTDSLLNLNDTAELKKLKTSPYSLYKNLENSRGNYDLMLGIITSFEWSIEGNRIRCKTEITSPDRIYAGLAVNSSTVSDTKKDGKSEVEVLGTLTSFVNETLPDIRSIATAKDPEKDLYKSGIGLFINYLKRIYPEKDKWKEIAYGIFYGRDMYIEQKFAVGGSYLTNFADSIKTSPVITEEGKNYKSIENYDNKESDFDAKKSDQTWITMAMIVEILNYHSRRLKGYDGNPMFRIDIDDCVISGHPNLMSTDGEVCLIPNAGAPKYFYGLYGESSKGEKTTFDVILEEQKAFNDPSAFDHSLPDNEEYHKILKNSSEEIIITAESKESDKFRDKADYRLRKICLQPGVLAFRDNLDETINHLRYNINSESKRVYAFPFTKPESSGISSATHDYPPYYSGYLKDIYFNTKRFGDIVKKSKTHVEVLQSVLQELSNACGGIWEFKLVDGTGKSGDGKDGADEKGATMKVVDDKFIYSVNYGSVYTFDYFDAESLLQSIKFAPTPSDAVTIRTMFAQTNNPDGTDVLSTQNELLNYHFKDRLMLEEIVKKKDPPSPEKINRKKAWRKTMEALQGLKPPTKAAFQMTTKDSDGKIMVKRLVMPSNDLLRLLLDDGDLENNPCYTGIMSGIQAQFTIQGLGGLRTFMMFLVRNLPEPYSHEDIVFRIIDLTESIESGKWTTTITAGLLPLRNHIRARLGLPLISKSKSN